MAPNPKVLGLIAVMCESVLVGVQAMLTVLVIWLLITRRRTMPMTHKVLFGASITMFLIAVAHLTLVVHQAAIGKVIEASAHARVMLATFQFIIGDLILIWRVWIIWGHNYWVAGGPLVIMILAAAFTFKLAFSNQVSTFFSTAPTALIVANTSICTLLIAGKISYARYRLRSVSGVPHSGGWFPWTVAFFIECGALYVACQITSLILNQIQSPGIHILLDLEIPLLGILPTLIVVLVQFELVGTNSPSHAGKSTMSFQNSNRVHLETFVSTVTVVGTTSDSERALELKV